MKGEERSEGCGAKDAPGSHFSWLNWHFGDKLTIRRKLVIILLVTSTLAVLVACGAFIVFSWFARQQALERDLAGMASAIGRNCEVALQFAIPEDASRILATVEARPAVVLACVYDADGQLFAAHDPESRAAIALPLEAIPEVAAHDRSHGVLRVAHPVNLRTRRIGTVYLEADMREIRAELARDSLILAAVAMLALVGSFLLSSRLQGLISDPILALAATARTISEAEDYSVRAAKHAGGEMATLVEAFNGMLDAIEVRDRALVASQERYQTMFHAAEVSLWEEDISEVQRTMRELRSQGVTDLRRYLEEHPDFVTRAANQVRVVDVNAATVKMFDAESKDELLGSMDRVFVPESVPVFREELIAIAEGRRMFAAEAAQQTLTDRRIVVLLSMALPGEGDPRLAIVSMMDITERKRAEQELEKHRKHLEELVEERTTQLAARATEAEELNSAMVNIMEDLRSSNVELEATGRELLASNQELDAFSYSVSHDLRAPLRHIDGFVGLLLKREKERLDPTSSRYLDTIAESSNRMGRLIDDLLAFSRTGRAEVHLQRVDSNEVVREARKGLSHLTEDRRIMWEVGDLPAAEADRGLFRLVWENLIGNAIKYTGPREEARIEIGATREGVGEVADEIAFFVRDNGVGFDPQYTHKLFGVFQRLHRDDEFEGTGIGLATVRRIVRRHGGRVWAEGKVAHGATFYFTLKEAL